VNEIEKKISGQNELSGEDLAREIEQLSAGLVYISETDAPIIPFTGGKAEEVTVESIRPIGKFAPGERAETRSFDDFFARLTRDEEWHNENDRVRVHRFKALEELLRNNLRDLKVFRIGSVRIDVYVAGLDRNGNLAGIKTKAVET
jgi:hypothetical protein